MPVSSSDTSGKKDGTALATVQHQELLTEHNAWRIHNHTQGMDDMALQPDTMHNLDAVMTPLAQATHVALFSLRSAGNVVRLTSESLRAQTFQCLRTAARSFANLESTKPLSRRQHGDTVLQQTLASFGSISTAVDGLVDAHQNIEIALQIIAKAIDELVVAVDDRRRAIFDEAVLDAAQTIAADGIPAVIRRQAGAECSYCCEPVALDNAAWIRTGACQHVPQLSCRACTLHLLYASTNSGRKSFATCPLCRAEVVWTDVCIVVK